MSLTPSEQNSLASYVAILPRISGMVQRIIYLYHQHGPLADWELHKHYVARWGHIEGELRVISTLRRSASRVDADRTKQTVIARRRDATQSYPPLVGEMGEKRIDPLTNRPGEVYGLIKEHGAEPVGLSKTQRRDVILAVAGKVYRNESHLGELWEAIKVHGHGLECDIEDRP